MQDNLYSAILPLDFNLHGVYFIMAPVGSDSGYQKAPGDTSQGNSCCSTLALACLKAVCPLFVTYWSKEGLNGGMTLSDSWDCGGPNCGASPRMPCIFKTIDACECLSGTALAVTSCATAQPWWMIGLGSYFGGCSGVSGVWSISLNRRARAHQALYTDE